MSKGHGPRDPARRQCTDEEYGRRFDETFGREPTFFVAVVPLSDRLA